ncbi:hypothetical protein COLO4_03174 [Corchorus olitorius]|uniref:Uncharacterized protein n=1 Tax=Corchorus olitorius TaxID=93759 RepID=A0A1R3KZH7_9ROSI|nr:hypothetical protein COLO4_03174 [Corchorus olitorius]
MASEGKDMSASPEETAVTFDKPPSTKFFPKPVVSCVSIK